MRRALHEFLGVPLAIIAGFIVLAILNSVLDGNEVSWLQPAKHLLAKVAPPQENQSMLRTVAPGMLTLMTITFVLLLTLVQRMSDVFTWVVVEQFLSRRVNQTFFGYFAGLSAYYVVVLTLVDPQQAVFSTVAALILSVLALMGLVVFGYLVLDQLRPPSVVERIVQVTIATRAHQLYWLRRVRSQPLLAHLPGRTVRSGCTGYLVDIDLDLLDRALQSAQGPAEIEFNAKLGSHMVTGTDLATVRAARDDERERLADVVLDALCCGRERQLTREPSYGVHQLSSMGWGAATQRDSEAALVTVDGLHALLAHWAQEETPGPKGDDLAVVYRYDTICEVLKALSSVAAAAIVGGQHQTCAQVLNVYAKALPTLSAEHQRTAAQHVRNTLTTVAQHPRTAELEHALSELGRALGDNGHGEVAAELKRIEADLDNRVPEHR